MGKYFRMEQKFGYLGISGLVRILAFFKVITWLIFLAEPGFGSKLMLDFQYVFQGEVWRLVSFMLIPGAVNPFILLIEVMFLLMIGEGLEQAWGAFGVTAYIVGSALCGILVAFVMSAFFKYPFLLNTAIYSSLLMAASCLYPDMIIQLMLVIPVKLKYVGMLAAGWVLYDVFRMSETLGAFLALGLPMLACLIPFVLVFVPRLIRGAKQRGEVAARRGRFERAKLPETEAFHKCDRCGATEVSEPDREFRINDSGEEICTACRDAG
jgi:hypothetical protein